MYVCKVCARDVSVCVHVVCVFVCVYVCACECTCACVSAQLDVAPPFEVSELLKGKLFPYGLLHSNF